MNFLGIHEISVEFDIPSRVVRYRFHQLREANKLVESTDYRREDFVDDQHFVWKINPVSFMRETGLKPVTKPASLVNESDNQKSPVVTTTVNQPQKSALQSPTSGNHTVNHEPNAGSQRGNDMVTKPGGKDAGPSLEREIIDVLKGQLVVKDGQIRDLTDQTLKLNDLNVKLVGQTLQQADRIQTLLRLTGGKSEPDTVVAKEGEVASDGKMPAKDSENGYQTVNNVDAHVPEVDVKSDDPKSGDFRPEKPLAA